MLKMNILNINFGFFDENSNGTNKIVTINFSTGSRDIVSDVTISGNVNVTMEDFNNNMGMEALKALVFSKLRERINEDNTKPVTPVTPPVTEPTPTPTPTPEPTPEEPTE